MSAEQISHEQSQEIRRLGHEVDALRAELAAVREKATTDTAEFWKCVRERDDKINRLVKELAAVREALDRYRYAVAFACADAWDGGADIRQRFAWARANDAEGHLSNNRVAEIGQTFASLQGQIPE
jgi:DNA repair exonuclease SbcCD ATPase subunit